MVHKKKYNEDVLYKLKVNMRNRIKLFLKSKNFDIKLNGTYKIVGCTPELLKEHIEKKFTEGMTWENYSLTGWNIDHIIPRSRGGSTTGENCVIAHKSVNSEKANRTPEEAGLKLIHQPHIPREIPSTYYIINKYNIKEWDLFLTHLSN
jgi:hypothetical protein